MKLEYDKKADSAYIYLGKSKFTVEETKELSDEVFVDYDNDGKPLGIEIIGFKDKVPSKTLKRLQSQTITS